MAPRRAPVRGVVVVILIETPRSHGDVRRSRGVADVAPIARRVQHVARGAVREVRAAFGVDVAEHEMPVIGGLGAPVVDVIRAAQPVGRRGSDEEGVRVGQRVRVGQEEAAIEDRIDRGHLCEDDEPATIGDEPVFHGVHVKEGTGDGGLVDMRVHVGCPGENAGHAPDLEVAHVRGGRVEPLEADIDRVEARGPRSLEHHAIGLRRARGPSDLPSLVCCHEVGVGGDERQELVPEVDMTVCRAVSVCHDVLLIR